MNVIEVEKPVGADRHARRTDPINLASAQAAASHHGHQPEAIDLAEDRDRFASLLDRLEIAYPPSSTAETVDEAKSVARRVGYPLLVRPSYVLGGRAWASSTMTRTS